jgi:hypothetical protein
MARQVSKLGQSFSRTLLARDAITSVGEANFDSALATRVQLLPAGLNQRNLVTRLEGSSPTSPLGGR